MKLLLFSAMLFVSIEFSVLSQEQFNGLDFQTTIIDDTTTVHDFINCMNQLATEKRIKSISKYLENGNVISRKCYNSIGKITSYVQYSSKKGKDSSVIYYHYDSINRLVRTVTHTRVKKEKRERLLSFEYDNENQVIECRTDNKHFSFFYDSLGRKQTVEATTFQHVMYPTIKRPKKDVYDTIVKKHNYHYDENNLLKTVVDATGKPLITYSFDSDGKTLKINRYNEYLYEYTYSNGQVVKSTILEVQYPLMDTVLFESCNYSYSNNKLEKCVCTTEVDYMKNYSGQYNYDEAGLLIEMIYKEKKIKYHQKYKYEFYD